MSPKGITDDVRREARCGSSMRFCRAMLGRKRSGKLQPSVGSALQAAKATDQPCVKSLRISPTPLAEISKPSLVPGLTTTP